MPAESELFRDKIEVSLDGRQIFYLFFGGAIIVALVFVLGVMVGKRVEARAHVDRGVASPAHDPLAALDALGRGEDLAFPSALAGQEAGQGDSARPAALGALDEELLGAADDTPPPAEPDKPAKPNKTDKTAGEADARTLRKEDTPERPDTRTLRKEGTPERPDARTLRKEGTPERPDTRKAALPAVADKADSVAARKPDSPAARKPDSPAARKPDSAQAEDSKSDKSDKSTAAASAAGDAGGAGEPRFTLQLSSFRDRAEADSFYGELAQQGYQPYIIEADVDGKGIWYRVRLGRYTSWADAVAAKKAFEASARTIAYVTRL